MFKSKSSARFARRCFIVSSVVLAFAVSPAATAAQSSGGDSPTGVDAVQLAPFFTTATRTPESPRSLGSAVSLLTAGELAQRQIVSIADALQSLPGVPVMQSGAPGSTTSVFMRGANSNQTLFLVDGIRFSDPNTDYLVFLGGARLAPGDRLEIARGPQSTLYGADAIGGVVSLQLQRGTGAPGSAASLEGGSFGTMNAAVASQGTAGASAWNIAASAGHTDNDRPHDRFNSANAALRLDRTLTDTTAIGATVRWFNGDFDSPGDRFTNDPNNRETESNLLATVFTDLKFSPTWSAHVTVGGQDRRYVNHMPAPNPPFDSPSATTVITNRRGVVDAQTTYAGLARNRITVGTTAEAHYTRDTGFGAIDNHQQLFALFAQDEYSPAENVFVTGGLRSDWFDTFGRATTGRATAAWLPLPRTLKVRASYGTGFRSPSFIDLYGRDPYYIGNSKLTPERDRAFDVGVDYYLPADRGTLSATWFESDFRNLIENDFSVFPSTVVNIGSARTRGLELAARADFGAGIGATASYTYLDAVALGAAGHSPLLRRPRNQFSADVHRDVSGVTVGAGVVYVGHRADVDAQTFATVKDPDYTVVRVYGAWTVTKGLTVKARVENALDRQYEAVNGFPALGLGAYGTIEYRF